MAGERTLTAPWWIYPAFSAGLSSVLLITLFLKLKNPPSSRARLQEKLIEDRREIIRRKLRFPFYLIDPHRKKSIIGRWSNAIFMKELRSRTYGRLPFIIRGMYGCLMLSIILIMLSCLHLGPRGPDFVKVVAVSFQLSLIVLVVPSLTAPLITQEKETSNLDMLRMTPIKPITIFLGKIEASLIYILILILSLAPLWFALYFLEAYSSAEMLKLAGTVMMTLAFSIAAGLFSSSLVNKTSSSGALTYSIVLLVCVLTLLPLALGEKIGPTLKYIFLLLNPFFSSIQLFTVEFSSFIAMPSLWKPNLIALGFLTLFMLVISYLKIVKLIQPGNE